MAADAAEQGNNRAAEEEKQKWKCGSGFQPVLLWSISFRVLELFNDLKFVY